MSIPIYILSHYTWSVILKNTSIMVSMNTVHCMVTNLPRYTVPSWILVCPVSILNRLICIMSPQILTLRCMYEYFPLHSYQSSQYEGRHCQKQYCHWYHLYRFCHFYISRLVVQIWHWRVFKMEDWLVTFFYLFGIERVWISYGTCYLSTFSAHFNIKNA